MEWVWGRDYLSDWPMADGGSVWKPVWKQSFIKVHCGIPRVVCWRFFRSCSCRSSSCRCRRRSFPRSAAPGGIVGKTRRWSSSAPRGDSLRSCAECSCTASRHHRDGRDQLRGKESETDGFTTTTVTIKLHPDPSTNMNLTNTLHWQSHLNIQCFNFTRAARSVCVFVLCEEHSSVLFWFFSHLWLT